MQRHAAPALARGIEVLRLLEGAEGLSLDEIARRLRQPKSSLLRILRTLAELGLVRAERRGRAKEYRAAVRMIPLEAGEDEFAGRLSQALEEIARVTDRVAEWYVRSPAGMILVERVAPPDAEVHVRARIGFLRPWAGELDAVAAVALAWLGGGKASGGFYSYVKDGVRGGLAARQVKRRVAAARRDGYIVDEIYNANGVRRTACIVLSGRPSGEQEPAGILAMAGHYVPGDEKRAEENLKALLRVAQGLSGGTGFRFRAEGGT